MSFDAFIQFEGIQGDSTDAAHKDWIEVQAFSHTVNQSTGGNASAQGTHAGGRVDIADFNIVKKLDKASPILFLYCCTAKPIPSTTFQLCRAMGEKTTFMTIVFKDAIVSAVRPSGQTSGEDSVPLEEVSIRPGEIHLEYTPTDPRSGGKTGAAVKSAWSLIENQPL